QADLTRLRLRTAHEGAQTPALSAQRRGPRRHPPRLGARAKVTLTPQLVVPCADLDAAIALLGLSLDMIMPADAPRIALGVRNGIAVRLVLAEDAASENLTFTLAVLEDAAHGRKLTDGGLHPPDGVRIDFFDVSAPPDI